MMFVDYSFSPEANTHTAYIKLSKRLREAGSFTGLDMEGRKLGLFQSQG